MISPTRIKIQQYRTFDENTYKQKQQPEFSKLILILPPTILLCLPRLTVMLPTRYDGPGYPHYFRFCIQYRIKNQMVGTKMRLAIIAINVHSV